jgi:hypothetical protein
MKKCIAVLVLGLIIAGASVFAVDWQAYPDGQKNYDVIINGGIGLGTIYPNYKIRLPPITASGDVNTPLGGLPFFFGGFFGISSQRYEYANYYTSTYTFYAFGARFGYHPNFGVKGLDLYLATSMGYYGANEEVTWASGRSGSTTSLAGYIPFYMGFEAGVRYFFVPVFGVFSEVGYSSISFIKVGITLKF